MDHVVYLDSKANELKNLLDGSKSMIIRGAAGRKLPHGRVHEGDALFFINNNAEGQVKAKGVVSSVFNSAMMSEDESVTLVKKNQEHLKLTDKQFSRWAGKRYIVLVGVKDVKEIEPFVIDKSNFGNMDDWLPIGNIDTLKK